MSGRRVAESDLRQSKSATSMITTKVYRAVGIMLHPRGETRAIPRQPPRWGGHRGAPTLNLLATVFALLLVPTLGACSDMQSEGKLADAQATYNTQDDNECRSHGTTTGTDPYFQCRRELAKDHVEAEAARPAQQ
jgi:hypothetical protein